MDKYFTFITDYKVSWGMTSIMAISPVVETILPVVSQIALIAGLQLVTLGIDYFRKHLKLPKRKDDNSYHEKI